MGKAFKKKISTVTEYARSDRRTLRQLAMSVISLIIASIVLATATFSWFSIKTSEIDANNFKLDCGKGLRVNDSGTSTLTFSQVEKYLIPASSVDGRNLFFPTDGSDFSSTTSLMTFRSANVGDKNVNYIQIDFTLTAQQNHTALYINDEKTSLKVKDEHGAEFSTSKAGALRSALWSSTAEEGVPNTPIVFNASNSTVRTAAVADVDRSTGAFIGDGRQVAHAFSEYSFGGEPVATLSKGVETKFSYIIWLEGCDSKCTDKILNKYIEVKLAFTTSWDKTQTIRFKDETEGSWVTNLLNRQTNPYSLNLHYEEVDGNNQPTGSNTDFNMYKYINTVDGEWSCNIPGDMRKNISFVLRPSDESETTYIFTMSSKTSGASTLDRGSNRQYIAELDSATSDKTKCRGYWKAVGDSDGSGHDGGGSFDGDDF